MSEETKYSTIREKIEAANQIHAPYPLFNRILEDIYECHCSPETNVYSDPDCLLLMGEAGAGKTTIYKTYA